MSLSNDGLEWTTPYYANYDQGEIFRWLRYTPLDENGKNESGDVYIYAFSRTEDGDPMLANIEDDEEYAKVAEAFDTILINAKKAEEAGAPLE